MSMIHIFCLRIFESSALKRDTLDQFQRTWLIFHIIYFPNKWHSFIRIIQTLLQNLDNPKVPSATNRRGKHVIHPWRPTGSDAYIAAPLCGNRRFQSYNLTNFQKPRRITSIGLRHWTLNELIASYIWTKTSFSPSHIGKILSSIELKHQGILEIEGRIRWTTAPSSLSIK